MDLQNNNPAPATPTPAPAEPQPTPQIPAAEPTPAVPAPAPAPERTPAPSEHKGFEPTGDVGLDLALEFVGKLGINQDNPYLQHAQKTGDFSLLEAHLATLGDKAAGYEKFVELGKQAYARHAEADKVYQAAMEQSVNEVIPAEEQPAVMEFLKANATEAELEDIRELWDHSPLARRMTAAFIYTQYQGTVAPPERQEGASPLRPEASAAPTKPTALSPSEYGKEVAALAAKIGPHKMAQSPEYAQLQQRRRAFRG